MISTDQREVLERIVSEIQTMISSDDDRVQEIDDHLRGILQDVHDTRNAIKGIEEILDALDARTMKLLKVTGCES
jgi:hypothetical protein